MSRLLALLVVLVSTSLVSASDGPTVKTRNGALAGSRGRAADVSVFRGIPYAAAPTGPLRWAPPASVPSWSGVRDATAFGANCPQNIVTEWKPWTYEFMAHGAASTRAPGRCPSMTVKASLAGGSSWSR